MNAVDLGDPAGAPTAASLAPVVAGGSGSVAGLGGARHDVVPVPVAPFGAVTPPTRLTPVVSLAVCTRDRASRLERLLASVEGQRSPPPFELVVVDNGSTDATADLLAAHQARASYPVTLVREPFAGLGRARNRALVAARAEIVAFTDDDCVLPPGHLAAVAAAFTTAPDAGAGASAGPSPRGPGRGLGFVAGRVSDAGGGQSRVALLEARSRRTFSPADRLRCGDLQGANLAVRARAAIAVGGFHAALGAGTPFRCEDADLCARMLAAGWTGAYRPELEVAHAHGRGPGEATALEAANDTARGAFLARRLECGEWHYLVDWSRQLGQRWGWRPVNAARMVAVTGREVLGAAHWSLAVGRLEGPRRGPKRTRRPDPEDASDRGEGAGRTAGSEHPAAASLRRSPGERG